MGNAWMTAVSDQRTNVLLDLELHFSLAAGLTPMFFRRVRNKVSEFSVRISERWEGYLVTANSTGRQKSPDTTS